MTHDRRRILVTGGGGFLGSHLCERLAAEGHDVLCLDNFFTGSKRNIEGLLGRPNFELIRHDLVNPVYLEVEEIYNLACPAAPIHYQYNPVKTVKTSVMGAINMLGLAKRVEAKILQASTSEVYGNPNEHPQTESYWGNVNPIGLRSCYDEGKRCAETLFFDYHRQHRLKIKVARIFNTYGPRMHPNDGRVVSNFIVQALKGEPITIYGDGSQTRSFCYVDDLVEGLIRLMNSPGALIGPVNLGNPQEYTILELAEETRKLTRSSSEIIFKPLPSDDPTQRKPDITLAREHLKWHPMIPLKVGELVEKTVPIDTLPPIELKGRRNPANMTFLRSEDRIYDRIGGLGMHTITFDTASQDLKRVILRTIKDKEETIIATDEGAVVILDESEWSNIKETLRLLSDKDSLAALIESHATRDKGERPAGMGPEEAFKDVQNNNR
jgi:UDP-glucuronate decarboxylase